MKRIWNRVSASQVEEFLRCPRRWFESAILKNRQPETEAMLRGKNFHKAVETYLKTGENTSEFAPLIEAGKEFLPPARTEDLLLEHEFTIPTYEGGPMWLGYIDMVSIVEK